MAPSATAGIAATDCTGSSETTATEESGPTLLPLRWPVAAVLAAIGLLAFSEVDRLIRNAVGPADGEAVGPLVSRTLADVTSINALGQRDAWLVWSNDVFREEVAFLLGVAVMADILFIAGYALILWPVTRPSTGPTPPWGWWRRAMLVTLLLAEAVEGALLIAAAVALQRDVGVTTEFATTLAVVAIVKWAAAGLLAVSLVRRAASLFRTRAGVRNRWRAVVVALWYHRVAVIVVVLLGAVTVLPYGGIIEQLPDVQRRWTSDPQGAWHGIVAVAGTGALALALWVLGRGRSARAYATYRGGIQRPEPEQWQRWMWLLGAVVAGSVLVALLTLVDGEDVEWVPAAAFVVAPVLLLGASWVLHRRHQPGGFRPVPAGLADPWLPRVVWRTGDTLAVALLAVAGLGLVRSFLAPALLHVLGLESLTAGRDRALLIAGAFLALLAFPMIAWIRHLIDGAVQRTDEIRAFRILDPREGADEVGGWPLYAPWILALAGMTGLVVTMLTASAVSAALGVIGITLLVVGMWTVILGGIEVGLQQHQPLEVFRLMGLTAAPVIAIAVIPAVAFSLFLAPVALHPLRMAPPQAAGAAGAVVAPGSPAPATGGGDLATAVAAWAEDACTVSVQGTSLRPMLLVAAQGGGIRAADWTARAMQVLDDDTCTARATFLSSGVSGGSVGLVLARSDGSGPGAESIAGPDALAAAVAGLTVNDMVAGALGLRLPEAGEDWTDRAGLVERAWERQVPSLAAPWSYPADGPETPTGYLVLNSTEARGGCRVVISQLPLGVGGRGAVDADDCFGPTDQAPVTIDLAERCGGLDMSWATAAMASARFPTVTPAGRVTDEAAPGCPGVEALRLVDGGYAEGSGLGTLSDLAPQLAAAIREENRRAGEPPIVPVVVYLQSAPRQDLAADIPGAVPEPLIPVVGAQAGGGAQISTDAYLQRLSAELWDICHPADDTGECAAGVRHVLPDGVVVVGPDTRPRIEAPLGWVMSGHSLRSSREAMTEQIGRCSRTLQGYGSFGALLAVLTTSEEGCSTGTI